MFRRNNLANRNNWVDPFTVSNELRFGLLLVAIVWLLYLFTVVNEETFPNDVVQNSTGLQKKLDHIDFLLKGRQKQYQMLLKEYRRINKELEKIDHLIATSQSKLNDAINNMNDKYEDLQPVEENEKFQRRLEEPIKKETSLEQTVSSNTLPHGKHDGVNRSDKKGALIKKNANIQTEPDQRKSNDGIFRVNKIEEKGSLIKIKENIQTETFQSKLNDGVSSCFSDENGIPQRVCDYCSYSDESGIPHVLGKFFGVKSAEAEKETKPDQSNLDDEDHSFSDENGPLHHVGDKYGFHDEDEEGILRHAREYVEAEKETCHQEL